MFFHVIATLSGGRRKSLSNKSEEDILSLVTQFKAEGAISAYWGEKTQTYQVLELRIFQTTNKWNRPTDGALESFIGKGKRNLYQKYEKKAQKILGKKTHRVFVVMPIQGEKFGSQDEQRIFMEYDKRFENIERVLSKSGCVGFRIDKEYPLKGLVDRIKEEIHKAKFLVADLTDERPACYFEAGYAEALKKPVIYLASKESVMNPKQPTKIHFDIHQNVNFFINHDQLREKLQASIDKNRAILFYEPKETPIAIVSEEAKG